MKDFEFFIFFHCLGLMFLLVFCSQGFIKLESDVVSDLRQVWLLELVWAVIHAVVQ